MINKKTLLFYALLVCLVYVSLEGLSYLGLLMLQSKDIRYFPLASVLSLKQKHLFETQLEEQPPLRGYHPTLGWSTIPLTNTELVRINSQGIRAEHDYSHVPPPEVVRLEAFGDSFTFGSEVDNEDTWERQLEILDSRFQVLNFGVGAYGLDQAYLRYLHDGIQFNTDIVIIGFMTENIYRTLNVFRPFYASSYWNNIYTKPRFTLDNGNLSLIENPLQTVEDYQRFVRKDEIVLRELGIHDYFYQKKYFPGPMDRLPSIRLMKIATQTVKERLNPVVTLEGSYAVSSEGFRLMVRLFEEFRCTALRNGSLPIIIIYPDLGDFSRHRSHQPKRYMPLLEFLRTETFRFVDVMDALTAYDPTLPKERLTVGKWGHYSRLGNSIVAAQVQQYLYDENLTKRDRIERLVQETCSQGNCCPNGSSTHVIKESRPQVPVRAETS